MTCSLPLHHSLASWLETLGMIQDYDGEARSNLLLHMCDLDNVPTVVDMTMFDYVFFQINDLASYMYLLCQYYNAHCTFLSFAFTY